MLCGLWVLLLREMSSVERDNASLMRTVELSDLSDAWLASLLEGARHRTKFMALFRPEYLQAYTEALKRMDTLAATLDASRLALAPSASDAMDSVLRRQSRFSTDVDDYTRTWIERMRAAREKRVRPMPRDESANGVFKDHEAGLRASLDSLETLLRRERVSREAALQGSMKSARVRLVLSLMLLTLLVAFVATIGKRRVLDRLKALEAGAQRLGEGELGLHVSVGRPDEIGHLAAAFNAMSQRLAEARVDEERLQRLDAIDQVVNSVNHEINNPLMAISGNAEVLLAAERNLGPEGRHRLSAILLEVQRIAQVTQQLRNIREPISEPYLDHGSRMIDLSRATHFQERSTVARRKVGA